jgi:hypothetical protein
VGQEAKTEILAKEGKLMLSNRPTPRHTTHPADMRYQAGLGHSPFRQVDPNKLRAKRLSCKTCDGKGCVGRCRIEKLN